MAKEPDLKRNPEYGPYLNAAFLCEKVIEDKDGVLSVIRIVDRITYTYMASPENPSSITPTVKAQFTFILMMKSGQNPGVTNIKILPRKPDNTVLSPLHETVHLDAPESRGKNLIIDATFTFDQKGIWWFEVFINDVLRTKIPMEVILLPKAMQQPRAHKL